MTGVSLESVYLEKHELFKKEKNSDPEAVFMASTLLLSGNYFFEQDTIDIRENSNNLSVRTNKKINDSNSGFELFDPLVINNSRECFRCN